MSMKPGATWSPVASMTRRPCSGAISPSAAMRSPTRPTSARKAGAPVPSSTVPPRTTRSNEGAATTRGARPRASPATAIEVRPRKRRRSVLMVPFVARSRLLQGVPVPVAAARSAAKEKCIWAMRQPPPRFSSTPVQRVSSQQDGLPSHSPQSSRMAENQATSPERARVIAEVADLEAGRLEPGVHPEVEHLHERVPARDGALRVGVEDEEVGVAGDDALEERAVLGEGPANRGADRLLDGRALPVGGGPVQCVGGRDGNAERRDRHEPLARHGVLPGASAPRQELREGRAPGSAPVPRGMGLCGRASCRRSPR